ncbi:MAG: S-layer homology domain-containing protein [Candidatus Peregrinibacteria bacterium]
MMLRKFPTFLAIAVLTFAGILFQSQAQTAGRTISVEQVSPQGLDVVSQWTLVRPDESKTVVNDRTFVVQNAAAGHYVLSIIAPFGMAAAVTQTLNGTTSTNSNPQIAFDLRDGDTIDFRILLTMVSSGKVSVSSDPPGFPFILNGPNNTRYFGNTPVFYDPMPIGLYTLTFEEISGCPTPPPQSGRLVEDERLVLSVKLVCDALKDLPQQQSLDKSFQFVSASVNGQNVTFDDVPLNQWYSEPVHSAIETQVMTGYADANGKPTGKFGINDSVTIATLTKIAHRLAGIDETTMTADPENSGAAGKWYAPFIASAEQRDWLITLNRSVDLDRPATRAEVVATFLQALRVPREWPLGTMFTDVSRTMPYADCVETAALKGLVSGSKDGNGQSIFRPTDPISRAEMAKIVSTAMGIFINGNSSSAPDARKSVKR